MDDLLYLVHRIPWPPNKGDKIRSYHILHYLVRHYRVHLGTFIDDPADRTYIGELEALCASVCVRPLPGRRARLRALRGFATGEALTLPWYRDPALQHWVDRTLEAHPVERALIFSSAMGQYVDHRPGLTRVTDFVDVDSDKWTQYAQTRRWPMNAVYRREGRKLLDYERRLARSSDASLFVSPAEAESFRKLAPERAGRVHAMNNGVDTDFFAPARIPPQIPYAPDARALVFSGAMDYWPNVDAAIWFARSVFPRIRETEPTAEFHIVGSRPTPAVQELGALPGVEVTGFVEDMRPWIGHAELAVAPLRIARGIQNKVLEAMALARTVVASPQALEGLTAEREHEVIEADTDPETFAAAVLRALHDTGGHRGACARARVEADYNWGRNLAMLDRHLNASTHPSVVTSGTETA
ncbi:TIGR03087 family PEP-CTERM/XrtA system glycosyltransferase [Thioalkalivibrio halophilus]|uniref:Sugar transferase n=1 Tax=Thioalkalivibrio halophilus TaxID=252474 RepID=A0A1V3A266_9GAMM|nr:TIGR03087 family PEP-CTERM/XrtA system glycosyltransferase [Thioalkalivibrio halophilus]OOC11434.1 sugar transferase [Thioalkalivibrio halophilus]